MRGSNNGPLNKTSIGYANSGQDFRACALHVLKRLGKGFLTAVVELDVVCGATRPQPDGLAHDKGNSLCLRFADAFRGFSTALPLMQESVRNLVR